MTGYARLYETEQQAQDAVNELRANGFPDNAVFMMTPASGRDSGFGGGPVDQEFAEAPSGAGVTLHALANAMRTGKLLGDQVDTYVEGLRNGHSVVAVEAPLGFGQPAVDILESFGPVDSIKNRPQEPPKPSAWDSDTPLSTALGLNLIKSNTPAPLSDYWGIPTLSGRRSFLSWLFGPALSPNFKFSSMLGLGLLTRGGTPLSSLFGIGTKLATPHITPGFGMPLQSESGTPLSSMLHLPLVTKRPLSSVFHIPLLTRRR
jgi:hypothetical protein